MRRSRRRIIRGVDDLSYLQYIFSQPLLSTISFGFVEQHKMI